jgi:hypothetical protein
VVGGASWVRGPEEGEHCCGGEKDFGPVFEMLNMLMYDLGERHVRSLEFT